MTKQEAWKSLMVAWGINWILSTPNQEDANSRIMRHFLESDSGDE